MEVAEDCVRRPERLVYATLRNVVSCAEMHHAGEYTNPDKPYGQHCGHDGTLARSRYSI